MGSASRSEESNESKESNESNESKKSAVKIAKSCIQHMPKLRVVFIGLAWLYAFGGTLIWIESSALGQSYVGSAKCGACHPAAFDKWTRGPHARAYASLNGPERMDSRCVGCHTQNPQKNELHSEANLAWQEPGNTSTAAHGGADTGIGCERCHGAGQYYRRDFVMRDDVLAKALGLREMKPALCQECHTQSAPSVAPFDYAMMWARIAHGSSGFGKNSEDVTDRSEVSESATAPNASP